MKKIVDELKQLVSLKDTTEVGDIVLIAAKEPQMLVYAHVSAIERDPSRKDEWWHVHMEMLSIPLQRITWTLRTPQMTGQEIFTMGGEERFVKAVDFHSVKTITRQEKEQQDKAEKKSSAKSSPLRRVK